jgi:hypothetical protein
MAKKSKIGELASVATKDEFAQELSSFTTLTADEIKALFPTESDRAELLELLRIVNSAGSENAKKAEIVEKIGTVSGAVVKLAKKFATGL